jgi:hypothetical protein
VLAEVDGFTAGETVPGGGAVAAGEHQRREQAAVIQVGGGSGDAEVVAAQTDRHVGGPQFVAHEVVVPDQLGLAPLVLGDGLLVVAHALFSPWSPAGWRGRTAPSSTWPGSTRMPAFDRRALLPCRRHNHQCDGQ